MIEKIDRNYCVFPLFFIINRKLELLWVKRKNGKCFLWGNSDNYEEIPEIIFEILLWVKLHSKRIK